MRTSSNCLKRKKQEAMHCLPGMVSGGEGTHTSSHKRTLKPGPVQSSLTVPHSLAEPPTNWKNCWAVFRWSRCRQRRRLRAVRSTFTSGTQIKRSPIRCPVPAQRSPLQEGCTPEKRHAFRASEGLLRSRLLTAPSWTRSRHPYRAEPGCSPPGAVWELPAASQAPRPG